MQRIGKWIGIALAAGLPLGTAGLAFGQSLPTDAPGAAEPAPSGSLNATSPDDTRTDSQKRANDTTEGVPMNAPSDIENKGSLGSDIETDRKLELKTDIDNDTKRNSDSDTKLNSDTKIDS